MTPSWNFQQNTHLSPADSGQSVISITSEQSPGSSHLLDIEPSRYAFSYSRLHLLGIPHEVRDEIWQTIFNDITARASASTSDWNKRPSTSYSGLTLTCHQVRDEIAFFWPRTIIQHNRVTTFVQPNLPNLKDFKRLALEVPVSQSLGFFQAAAQSLKLLAPVLQDLRLFFVGSDKFQTPLSLDACGLYAPNVDLVSKRLPIDGQRHSIRQPLFLALRGLYNLRSLVLSNHNYPVLPKLVLEHKPYLKYLHMVVDPRTTVHKRLDEGRITPSLLAPVQQGFPPVEVLKISANASLNSLHIAAACTLYLRHLTWTVPDLSLQSAGGLDVNWRRDTGSMLYLLRINARQLNTLRICFHETFYEADTATDTLMYCFQHHLPHLPIKNLEIHVSSHSPWFGREIIQSLPNSLRRLYMSRELLDEVSLAQDIDNRYMAYHQTAEEAFQYSGSQFLKTMRGTAQENLIHVGEDKNRTDFISLGGGKLGFIGYEYEPRKPTRFGNSKLRIVKAEDTKMWILTLNGRLLDRERNMHLKRYDGGRFIAPKAIPTGAGSTVKPDHFGITENHGSLWVFAPPTVMEIQAAAEELQDSIIVNWNDYFGNEEEAAMVFEKEPGVQPADVLERLWPDEVSAHEDDHWITDYKPIGRVEDLESLNKQDGRLVSESGKGCWAAERTAYWVQSLTWCARENSYFKIEEREKLLSERDGTMLESLET